MRYRHAAFVCCIAMTAAVLSAQTPAPDAEGLVPAPSWAYNDIACAPSLLLQKPAAGAQSLRVVGVQDITHRNVLAPPDVLVIGAGSNAGIRHEGPAHRLQSWRPAFRHRL